MLGVDTEVAFRKGQLVLHGCLPVAGHSPSAHVKVHKAVYIAHCVCVWLETLKLSFRNASPCSLGTASWLTPTGCQRYGLGGDTTCGGSS